MLHPAQIRTREPVPGMTLSQSSATIRAQRCHWELALGHQRGDCCPGPPLGLELELEPELEPEHRTLVHFLLRSPLELGLDLDLRRGLDPCRGQEDQLLGPGQKRAWQ